MQHLIDENNNKDIYNVTKSFYLISILFLFITECITVFTKISSGNKK